MIVLGVTGRICAGKDSVAECLASEHGFVHISIDDLIQAEVRVSSPKRRTRAQQREYAVQRRVSQGADYFVRDAMASATRSGTGRNIVISGVTCIGEATFITDHLNGRIIGVDCDDATTRWNRIADGTHGQRDVLTRAEFEALDKEENSGDHNHEPNVGVVLQLAEFRISNTGGLTELCAAVGEVIERLVQAAPNSRTSIEGEFPPLLTALIGHAPRAGRRMDVEPVVEIDDWESNYALERQSRALSFVKSLYSLDALDPRERALAPLVAPTHAVSEIGNQFGVKLLGAFLEDDPASALARFRAIAPSTTDEELALLLNDTEFLRAHAELVAHLASIDADIRDSVAGNLREAQVNDTLQFNITERRSSATMFDQGMTIRIDRRAADTVREARLAVGDGMVPALELLKNARILEVSSFEHAKASLAIHDAIDHVWLFDLLQNEGVFERFEDLFDAIGNPQAYDIFRREGEVVASIGFGVRYWANMQVGFVPLLTVHDLAGTMERHFDAGRLSDRHLPSFLHLRALARNPFSRESQSLGFVFSNYMVELNEQRRKSGRIKEFSKRLKQVIGELDPLSPDYLAFFVEAHRLLLDSHNKHRDTLLQVHLIVEEFLTSDLALDGSPLQLPLRDLRQRDFTGTTLPPDRISWMARNFGFSAIREPVI